MRFTAWGATNVGMRRDHNEDAFSVREDLRLCVVADGMGGHAGGALASAMAVRTVVDAVAARVDLIDPARSHVGELRESPVAELLSTSVRTACGAIFRRANAERHLIGMGTTVVSCLFHGLHAFVAHVGDSLAYLVRQGRTTQITEDHSLVNEQVQAGLITPEQAKVSRFKNIITRSVGFEKDIAVDVAAVALHVGDCFILCCDGLSNLVESEEIGTVVEENFLRFVPDLLIGIANDRGGDDNITVTVAYVDQVP